MSSYQIKNNVEIPSSEHSAIKGTLKQVGGYLKEAVGMVLGNENMKTDGELMVEEGKIEVMQAQLEVQEGIQNQLLQEEDKYEHLVREKDRVQTHKLEEQERNRRVKEDLDMQRAAEQERKDTLQQVKLEEEAERWRRETEELQEINMQKEESLKLKNFTKELEEEERGRRVAEDTEEFKHNVHKRTALIFPDILIMKNKLKLQQDNTDLSKNMTSAVQKEKSELKDRQHVGNIVKQLEEEEKWRRIRQDSDEYKSKVHERSAIIAESLKNEQIKGTPLLHHPTQQQEQQQQQQPSMTSVPMFQPTPTLESVKPVEYVSQQQGMEGGESVHKNTKSYCVVIPRSNAPPY